MKKPESMKPILENIVSGKLIILLFSILLQHQHSHAQNAVLDTIEMSQTDSEISIEQTDTNYGKSNYFNDISSHVISDTIELRQVPQHVMDSLKKDDAFWYADKTFKKKIKQERNVRTPTQWISMPMLVIIVVIFIALLGWYLYQNNILKNKGGGFKVSKSDEHLAENIFDINYHKEIESAISSENYRLAVRLLFLQVLKNLSQRNIIQYKQDRTNFDYLAQLSSGSYYNDFFRLARNFEYTWYGKFDINREMFGIIKNDFENFDRKLL
jgi:hypothetical protein